MKKLFVLAPAALVAGALAASPALAERTVIIKKHGHHDMGRHMGWHHGHHGGVTKKVIIKHRD